ncbi:MAG: hypothetical protein ACREL2_01305 [Gemmatimonadales bacterium]
MVLLIAGCSVGCALPAILPPMSSADAVPAAPAPPPPLFDRPLAAPAPGSQSIPVLETYDSGTGMSRRSVSTHPGENFFWVRHPRLTFYFDVPGADVSAPPATVEFVFHTQSPQDIVDNRLSFTCDRGPAGSGAVPAFSERPDILTVNQFLLYRLPVGTFDAMASCTELTVTVGDTHVAFQPGQMAALRDLARRMYPPGGINRSGRS